MILVVDDEPIYQKLITNALKETGEDFDVADDGYAAIDKIQKNKYLLAIVDLVLPGPVNGNDIIKRIKKINPDTAVIVCTGYANQSILSKTEKAGADTHLLKPFNPEQLQQKVALLVPEFKKKLEAAAAARKLITIPAPSSAPVEATLITTVPQPLAVEAAVPEPADAKPQAEYLAPDMLANLPEEIVDDVMQLGIIYELQAQERQTINFTESITFVLTGQADCYYDELAIGSLKTGDAIGYESLMKNIDPMAYIELEAAEETRLCIISKIEFLKYFCSRQDDYISVLEKNVRKILPQNPLLNTDYYKK
ncbi:MAG TPA: response regulator [bacterium]|nr:response regulator [bacterium]HPN44731.1 response regulator [bacterium]